MKNELNQNALSKAVGGQSMTNYPTIIKGFLERGIPEAEIRPRENVFTFNAWKALGKSVKKGEHGVKILTYLPRFKKVADDKGNESTESYNIPWSSTVFHVSQVH